MVYHRGYVDSGVRLPYTHLAKLERKSTKPPGNVNQLDLRVLAHWTMPSLDLFTILAFHIKLSVKN